MPVEGRPLPAAPPGRTMVVGRPALDDPDYRAHCPQCNPLLASGSCVQLNFVEEFVGHGLRTGMAAIFIAGELAGMGMLAAPWAVVNLGLVGFLMLMLFGIATAYTGSCLASCWFILEERYLECRQYPCQDPYATIAFYAVGKKMCYFTTLCVQITLFGAATVYLMLIAQSAQKLFIDHPDIKFCTWLFVFAIVLSSLMFMESPKDHYVVGLGCLLTTMTACYFIIMQIMLDDTMQENSDKPVPHNGWDAKQFFLSFGTIIFAYGGASAFPSIQNDMFKKTEYSHSIFTSFVILAILFGSIIVGGYIVYGDDIDTNILFSLGPSWMSDVGIFLITIHLILAFLIIANPITRKIEQIFSTPTRVGFQKFTIRVTVLLGMIFLGESVTNFSNLVALVGSTTVTLTVFVLPLFFYIRLCSMINPMWPDRSLSWKSKICLYLIITAGILIGGATMVTAIISILEVTPCYWSFFIPDTICT